MKECPGADALTSIGAALDWDVDAGLRHLTTCDACTTQLRTLRVVHESFVAEDEVDDHVVAKITHLISAEAAHEKARSKRAQTFGWGVESLLAGATAIAVTNGGGAQLSGGLSATVFAFAASAVLVYRVFASSQSTASRSSLPSIQ